MDDGLARHALKLAEADNDELREELESLPQIIEDRDRFEKEACELEERVNELEALRLADRDHIAALTAERDALKRRTEWQAKANDGLQGDLNALQESVAGLVKALNDKEAREAARVSANVEAAMDQDPDGDH